MSIYIFRQALNRGVYCSSYFPVTEYEISRYKMHTE